MEKKFIILVLGSNGMLGHVLVKFFKNKTNHQIYTVSRSKEKNKYHHKLDLTNFYQLEILINNLKPDFIINCAGVLVKNSNENIENAILINAYLPHFISKSIHKNCKLIHISTDCVFDGVKGNYDEIDSVSPVDVYGRTKSLGEINNQNNVLTIRTSIIGFEISNHKTGLLEWFINEKKPIYGFKNEFWNGVTTLELAKIINYCISVKWFHGINHLSTNMKISKYELLLKINSVLKLNKDIIPKDSFFKDRSLKTNNFDSLINNDYAMMLSDYIDFYKNVE
jgi:dTDP-4-dehydrorhamnose reductase